MKKTEWYPGTVKPVRVGFYEVQCPLQCDKHYFDGSHWYENEAQTMRVNGFLNARPWRGLTQEQK